MLHARLVDAGDLPCAELSACGLDGDLFPIIDAWASIAEPEGPELRVAAFAATVDDERLIVERQSAAWVWGAQSRTPRPLQACLPLGSRRRNASGDQVLVRECSLQTGDIVDLGTGLVTSPLRTVLDLLRERGPWTTQLGSAVMGLLLDRVDPDEAEARLAVEVRHPYGRRALRRFAALRARDTLDDETLGQAALTR